VFLINRQLTDPAARPLSDEPATFSSPATDPAYDFTIEAYYRKTEMNRRRTSPWLDERERIRTSVLVRETAREISREYSIYEPGAAERAINAELVRRLGEGGRVDRSVWSARVEVRPPDEVREMLRKDLKGRYEIESRARANGLLLDMTDQLNQRWAAFLKGTAKTPAAPYALKLAEKPENFAEVLQEMLNERNKDTDEWLTLVTRIVEAHRDAGILDLVVESDTVLRKTLEMMGIELPPVDRDAPLVPDSSGK
jgi:hypothetical protein